MAEIGQVIEGKYEILKLIGQGGMSKVYLAIDIRLNKQWAVKEIIKDKKDETFINNIIAEVDILKKLNHPNIVRIVDVIDNDNIFYIVMDYICGYSLNEILEENGAQPYETVVAWAKELCDVLLYLHTLNPPIIYRDMKPSNVILTPDGRIKIIDFGIAREFKKNAISDTVALGTKGYAAPEQYGGKGQTDARTDIYCLGVTLYHLLTGVNPCDPPYEIQPIRKLNPQLPIGLETIIGVCTRLNPDERYQSCEELFFALENYHCLSEEHFKRKIDIQFIKNILKKRKHRYVNQECFEDINNSISIDDAYYFAEIIANMQKVEKNFSQIKGPKYYE